MCESALRTMDSTPGHGGVTTAAHGCAAVVLRLTSRVTVRWRASSDVSRWTWVLLSRRDGQYMAGRTPEANGFEPKSALDAMIRLRRVGRLRSVLDNVGRPQETAAEEYGVLKGCVSSVLES